MHQKILNNFVQFYFSKSFSKSLFLYSLKAKYHTADRQITETIGTQIYQNINIIQKDCVTKKDDTTRNVKDYWWYFSIIPCHHLQNLVILMLSTSNGERNVTKRTSWFVLQSSASQTWTHGGPQWQHSCICAFALSILALAFLFLNKQSCTQWNV